MRQATRRNLLVAGWIAGLAVLALAPTLRAGYTLSYDLVFVPRQDLLPATLGLSEALPRAVPQDAVLTLLTAVAPGWVWEKLALFGVLGLAGAGAVRITRGLPTWARATAGGLALWNPYVAERLVIGHWGLLLAYACLPWALVAARDVRSGPPTGAWARLLLLIGLASLTPTGGLLIIVLAVPVAVGPGSLVATARRWLLVSGAVLLQLPWLLPALLHPQASVDPAGVAAFGLRTETPFDGPVGAVLTALGGGGVWNAGAVPASRGTPWALVGTVLLVALAVVGARATATLLGWPIMIWLSTCAAAGLLVALLSATGWGLWVQLVTGVSGGGLLRDSQKVLAPLVFLIAIAAVVGAVQVVQRVRDPGAALALTGAAVLLPLLLLPDMVAGVAGRLSAVSYPADWYAMRQALQADERPGDVVVLPWSTFRRFTWNPGRTVLDPAARWLPRSSVVDDRLVVARPDGTYVTLAAEDPRGAVVGAALDANRPLLEVLPDLGVGWVLVESGQPVPIPTRALAGLERVPLPTVAEGALPPTGPAPAAEAWLELWRVPGDIAARPWPAATVPVVAVDITALLLLGASAGVLINARRGSGRAARVRGRALLQSGSAEQPTGET